MQNHPTRLDPSLDTEPGRLRRRRLLGGMAAAWTGGLSAALAGCGGGGSDAGDGAPQQQPLGVDSGGTGRRLNSFIQAALDGVSPPMVGTVRIDVQQSQFTGVDGQPLAAPVLAPGMTVQVLAAPLVGEGPVQVARASMVQLAEQLLGPVTDLTQPTAAGAAPASFKVWGQTVALTARTVIDLASAATVGQPAPGLTAGRLVRVWGELDAMGERVVATRVDLAPDGAPLQLRGPLAALDAQAGWVAIGGGLFQAPPAELAAWAQRLAPGQVVRARVAPAEAGQPSRLLSLRGDTLVLPDDLQVELEGRLGLSPGPLQLLVDGVVVALSGLAAAAADVAAALQPGTRVSVRGRSLHGVVLAQTVTPESDDQDPVTELEGTISSADLSSRSFVLRGITVLWDADTRIVGGPVSLIAARRKAAVKGRLSANRASLRASSIHVER